ncbi:MAG: methyltransferase [Rhodoplanes sp.]
MLAADLLKQFRRRHCHIYPLLRPLFPYRKNRFAAITVHYKKHLDGGGRGIGQGFIPFLQSRGMPKQRRVFEWCAGPGFIGFSLLAHDLCETLCLADVNPEAVAACRRTVEANRLSDRVSVYQSDNLKDIPASERWDLVVSNPPHFAGDYILGERMDEYRGDRRAHDPDWRIHREFFATVAPFLSTGGVIILQENNAGSTAETFRGMVEEAGLEILFVQGAAPQRTADGRIYYIGIKRAGDAAPAWARPL